MLLTLTMAVGDDSETLPCFFQREAARPMVSAALNSRRLAHAVTHLPPTHGLQPPLASLGVSASGSAAADCTHPEAFPASMLASLPMNQ